MTTISSRPLDSRVETPGRGGTRNPRRGRFRRHAWNYVFLIPMLLLFAGFTIWPMIASWWYSFFDWDGIGPPTEWIGAANFREILGSHAFWNAFGNSLLFSGAAIAIQMPLALFFALLLNNPRLRGRNLYRLLLFLPTVTTTAIVGIVFAIMLDPSGGFVNGLLQELKLVNQPINFLGSEHTALPTLIAIELWKDLGITLIYWLAALQTVPPDVRDAAAVDGAGRFQLLRHITLPILTPLAVVILLLTFQSSLNPFDLVQATTQGGPNFSTDVVSTYVYRYAFDPSVMAPQYGYACAAGVVFGVVTLLLTLVQAPLLRRRYLQTAR